MKFKEYDTVKVLKNCDGGVIKGEYGVIIMAFEVPNEAYEVEFLNSNGYPKAQCTLLPNEIELVK